jgi:hypothetical protein
MCRYTLGLRNHLQRLFFVSQSRSLTGALNELGFGYSIYTYTSWTEQNTTVADDFLNQVYNDTFSFREYANSGVESDIPLSVFEVIQRICSAYNLIIRQSNGAWHVYQISALTSPSTVKRFTYNPSGTQTADGNVDLRSTVDRLGLFVLPNSFNRFNPGLKSVSFDYQHRSGTNDFLVNQQEINAFTTPAMPNATYSIDFVSGGDEYVVFTGTSIITTATDWFVANDWPDYPEASYLLKSSQYYWDDIQGQWVESLSGVDGENQLDISFSDINVANDTITLDSTFVHGDVIRVSSGTGS